MVKRFFFVVMCVMFIVVEVEGQGIFKYDLEYGIGGVGIEGERDDFIDPSKSLVKLQRQLYIEYLPSSFYPEVEEERNDFNKRALRYGIGYYRDCEVAGLAGFFDVMLPMRFDTRGGVLKVSYYRNATIINPSKVEIAEDKAAFAVITANEVSALILFLEGGRQQLISFEGLFTENPRAVAFISTDDVDGVKGDLSIDKFAVFVRGGAARASLFVLNTDVELKDIKTFEVLKDLASTDRAYIFAMLPALVYRAVAVQ